MRKILPDLTLLAAGIGLGALICAAATGDHTSGNIATAFALLALGLRVTDARL